MFGKWFSDMVLEKLNLKAYDLHDKVVLQLDNEVHKVSGEQAANTINALVDLYNASHTNCASAIKINSMKENEIEELKKRVEELEKENSNLKTCVDRLSSENKRLFESNKSLWCKVFRKCC